MKGDTESHRVGIHPNSVLAIQQQRRKSLSPLSSFLEPVPTHLSGIIPMATLFQEAFLDSHQVAEIVTPPLSSDSPWTHLCHHLYHLGGNCLFTCLAPLNRWPLL